MAVSKAPAAKAEGEVSEHEYQATLNRAVEDTEREIFADALGEGELDNDGDTSLEEMGDGLEGEVEDDADEEAEGDEKAEGDDEGESEEEKLEADVETADGREDMGDPEEQSRDERGRFQDDRRIPPGRLREEANQRRAAEDRAAILQRQVDEMNGRLSELSARANAPPQQRQTEAPPKPDMFAEPEKYEAWVIEQAERRADARASQRFTEFQQQQQAVYAQRVDESLATAARGERAFEFGPAYNALTSLDPRNPQARATVASIYNAADPAKALFDWWDQNGGPEYRERVYEQVAPRVQRNGSAPRQQMRNGNGQDQPRHVFRPGQRLPSLNSATGSNSQRTADPEMLDGSERSIFEYGTRR